MPSLPLRKRKALDATGQPIDPTALYEPVSSHARGHKVYNVGLVVLRGDNPDLLGAPQLWVRENLPTPDKRQAMAHHVAKRRTDVPEPPPDPMATRVLGPIPPERRRVALRNYVGRDGVMIHVGDVHDVREPFVQANEGDLFGPDPAAA